jgi:hypothetical protein
MTCAAVVPDWSPPDGVDVDELGVLLVGALLLLDAPVEVGTPVAGSEETGVPEAGSVVEGSVVEGSVVEGSVVEGSLVEGSVDGSDVDGSDEPADEDGSPGAVAGMPRQPRRDRTSSSRRGDPADW